MTKRPVPWRALLALLFCLSTMTLAPTLADARAGSSWGSGASSFGSRGSRSFEGNGASPLSRSATPTPSIGSGYGYGGGGFFSRHPFLTGMFGGFVGAWLFGGGFFGHALGFIVTIVVIGFLVSLLFRLFAGGGFRSMGGGMMPRSVGAAAAPQPNQFRGRDIGVGDADLSAFQGIHAQVQEAWSRGDIGHLRGLMTPEMVGYFNEELTRNSSQGVQNIVSNVNLLKGEVTEAWEENDLQYASAFLRWSAIDYVVRLGANGAAEPVVSGNPRSPVEEEEMWTFVRRRGGQWLLSAIQQV